jgi:curved DNA-binding protein
VAAYKDYYQTLGVARSVTPKEIRAAFRKLAAKHHPDKNPGDKAAEERFKEINEAYTVLSDSEKRKVYDQYGSAGGPPPFRPGTGGAPGDFGAWGGEAGDFSDFFQSLFGGGFAGSRFSTGASSPRADPFAGFGRRPVQQPVQQDVRGEVTVSLEEAYSGGSRTVSIADRRLDVILPKGTRDGARLRLRGQAPGGGDVYLTVRVEPHPVFSLDGDDVRLKLSVPDYQAALGATVRVPTLDGDVDMTLPKRTQSGRVLRLRGRGWPKRDGSRGDALAEIRIVIPEGLSDLQLGHYEGLRELSEPEEKAKEKDAAD